VKSCIFSRELGWSLPTHEFAAARPKGTHRSGRKLVNHVKFGRIVWELGILHFWHSAFRLWLVLWQFQFSKTRFSFGVLKPQNRHSVGLIKYMTALRKRQRTTMSILLCTTPPAAAFNLCSHSGSCRPRLTPLAKCTRHFQGKHKDKHHSACSGHAWKAQVWGHAGGLGLFFFCGRRRVDAVWGGRQ